MKILITNDDGVYAPGLAQLASALSTIADIRVVAPDRNRSAASHSLTLERPLRITETHLGYYSVSGTPTDCVHLAVTGLFEETPDMVVAGINAGANLGDDVLYSGTVAAAMEGRFLGYPAIAISLVGDELEHYDTAAEVAKRIVSRMSVESLPSDTILNVNVPDIPFPELAGIKTARCGHRHCAEPVIRSEDPKGKPIYWVGPPGPEQDAGPDTDFYAINHGYVAMTPLQVDMTRHAALSSLTSWSEGLI